MSINPLVELTKSGQSIWYDGIERGLITSGELKRLIDEYEIRGVTSNPTIFEKAIDSSDDYSDQLREQAERQKSASEIFEALAVRDIQMAADLLAPVFEKTDGTDGFVSLECSPLLAHDTPATIDDVRHLWRVLNRKNVMITIVTQQILDEGVSLFRRSFEQLMKAIQSRRDGIVSLRVSRSVTAPDQESSQVGIRFILAKMTARSSCITPKGLYGYL